MELLSLFNEFKDLERNYFENGIQLHVAGHVSLRSYISVPLEAKYALIDLVPWAVAL